MMLCEDIRVAYLSMPRSGTHSVYDVLGRHFGGRRYRSFHQLDPPRGARDWCWFTTVRNPYARAASSWQWATVLSPRRTKLIPRIGGTDFAAYCRWLVANRSGQPWFAAQAQIDRIQRFCYPLQAIRIEHFSRDAEEKFPWWQTVAIPHLCVSKHGDWRQYMTDEIAADIQRWAGEDFRQFGYSTEWQ